MSEYGMSNDSAIQNRKFAKTCVEKKRRDRINRCLDELKDLMSQADDKAKYQKMEKAEILEMAVNYMKTMRSKQSDQSSSTTTTNNAQYYGLAFRQCLNEFQNYLALFPGIKDDFKSKIMSYMTQRYMESLTNSSNTNSSTKSNLKRTISNRYTPYNSQSERQPVKQQQQSNENLITVITNAVDQQNMSSHSSNSSFSSSSYFYNSENTNTNNKFGGSCSSLDGFQFQKQNQTTMMMHNDSHNESSNSDNIMSPAMSSPCSSPVSSHTNQLIDNNNKFNMISSSSSSSSSSPVNYYSNYEDFMKVWRPW
jgi:hypothetical protein